MITFYHNPRCSKSRAALALLEEREVALNIVEYLKVGFSAKELEIIIERLNVAMSELIRTNENEFRQHKFDLNDKSAVINAIIARPKIFQRPLGMNEDMAVIGRPPEAILDILKSS